MKKISTCIFLAFASLANSQNEAEYAELCKKAYALYEAKDYKASSFTYSSAFKALGWKGTPNDRYNAACSWSMANYPDSAFFNLMRLAKLMQFSDYNRVLEDSDLDPLHKDKRWDEFLKIVKENKDKAEAKLNKPLVRLLDSIHNEDQKYRKQIDDVSKKYGWESKEMQDLWKIMRVKDSSNLVVVKGILDKQGWLGPDEIGGMGSSTLFLVIQHSDQETQEKYLPMMREAVKNRKASGSSLALLEDRVALGQGKKQNYGSQVMRDPATNEYYVLSLEDPDNVDKRRAEVGLPPLADYLGHWNAKWDVEEYKKKAAAKEAAAPEIVIVKFEDDGKLKLALTKDTKDTLFIEQFRWGKWTSVSKISTLGRDGIQYSSAVHPVNGINKIRIRYANAAEKITEKEFKVPPVKFTVDKKKEEVVFSDKTVFELIDNKKQVIKQGVGTSFSYKEIPKGSYTLNYADTSTQLKK